MIHCLGNVQNYFGPVQIVLDPSKLFWTCPERFGPDHQQLLITEFHILNHVNVYFLSKIVWTCQKSLRTYIYTRVQNVWPGCLFAGNQSNHQNFHPSLLTNKVWHVFIGIKQKKTLNKKKSKWQTHKKCIFQNSQNFSCENFMGCSLGK